MQFYSGDWLKDPAVTMCSASTRGIWVDLICVMHESDRSGLITGTPEQLCRLGRCTAVELSHAIEELTRNKAADVTNRNGVVTLVNRRMQREHKQRLDTAFRVSKHRSVTHPKQTESEVRDQNQRSEKKEEARASRPFEGDLMSKLVFPNEFLGNKFQQLFLKWMGIRLKGKKPKTDWLELFQGQIRQVEKWGYDTAFYSVEQALTNQWDGIHQKFPPVNRNANGTPKPQSTFEIKTIIEAKEKEMAKLKSKHCSEGPMGNTWNDEPARKQFIELKKGRDELSAKLAAMG